MPSHVETLTSAYHPAPSGTGYVFAVTVTSTPASLGSLLDAIGETVPVVPVKGAPQGADYPVDNRYPRHVIFQVPSGASNSIFMTWDGNTNPSSSVTAPGAPTITPQTAGGGTTWTYKLVAKYADGGYSAASSAGTTADGEPDLTVLAHGNTITWTDVTGAASYDVYRTVAGTTPNTTGLIGNVLQGVGTLLDNGLAGDGSTAPSAGTAIGWEMQKGTGYKFENCYDLLSDGGDVAPDPATAFLFAAANSTVMTVIFSD